jgi:glycosyltransferase involved in cell wall biosynthesis
MPPVAAPSPKVLHLFNVFGALTERAMFDYTMGLSQSGFDLTIGCETLAAESPRIELPLTKLRRIEVQPTDDVASQMRHIAATVDDPAMSGLLGEKFQLVHGHFGPRLLQGAAWITSGVPMLVSLYGYDVGRLLRDRTWIDRYRWAAKQGVVFVALARFMEWRLLGLGIPAKQVRYIPLGIDQDSHVFDPRPAPTRPRFVFVGRFVEKKGADTLLQAMAHLVQSGCSDSQLDLIGGGPLENALRQQVAMLQLEKHVRFVGTVPFVALFDHLRDCTALVQPSQEAADGDMEGAPMVLMTAQACGVPCLTTHHSGNPETIPTMGRQFVVSERDPPSLAKAMHEMIALSADRRSSLQTAGRRWIEERFNLRHTIGQYARLYRELMAGVNARGIE